jgi:uncharacterized membrane protein
MNAPKPKQPLQTAALPVAIIMLIFWAVMTFAFDGPGWVHIFLSLGVFLLIWGVTLRAPGARKRG